MKIKLLSLGVVFLFLAGCAGGDPGPNVRDLTGVEQALVQASNGFGFELFAETVAQGDGGNVFLSPLSVSIALGMTYFGTGGNTAAQMGEVLGFGALTPDEIGAGYHGLIDLLTALDPEVAVEIANSIWVRAGFELLAPFVQAMEQFFYAAVTAVDFGDPTTVERINAWVAEKTHGKIDKILDSTSEDFVMVLLNAVYFKGSWTIQFDPEETRAMDFAAPGGAKTVQMMHLNADLLTYQDELVTAVDLPYGHELYRMAVLVPNPGVELAEVIAALDGTFWAGFQTGLFEQEADVYLPRFELEYKTSLVPVLQALGMTDAFEQGVADFSGLQPDHEMWISDVIHKTYVKLDEEGTEAAAVTAVVVVDSSMPFQLMADRPFLVVLHDANSRALLFMGAIVDPPSS